MVAIRRIPTEPKVEWRTASPLWLKFRRVNTAKYQRPMILRFANDAFMDDFIDLAQTQSNRMNEWRLRREIWRKPPTTPTLEGIQVSDDDTDPQDLVAEQAVPKLYQPAHERYYLVTASLVCRIVGLPDKTVDATCDESVAFVLRRRIRDSDNQLREYAFVNEVWQPALADGIHADEATHPLFPTTYDDDLQGQERRLFAGMIPVSQREKMLTAKRVDDINPPALLTVDTENPTPQQIATRIEDLLTVLDSDVIQPWRALNNAYELENTVLSSENTHSDNLEDSDLNEFIDGIDKIRDRLQVSSWYVMLDLVYYLQTHVPDFWSLMSNNPDGSIPPVIAATPAGIFWQTLQDTEFRFENRSGKSGSRSTKLKIADYKLQGVDDDAETNPEPSDANDDPADLVSFARALVDVANAADDLEALQTEFIDDHTDEQPANPYPNSRFLLNARDVREVVDDLADLIADYLDDNAPDLTQRIPILPLAAQISEEDSADIKNDYSEDQFIIRCVYIRPHKRLGAGRYTLSPATERFTLAPFFDPDAPARPIRIPMPIDTSPAGLRKFAKNTMFVLSDTLACQVEAARKMSFGDLVLSVLPWPFHKDLPDVSSNECKQGISIGMLCTLSIPIITIVALILLIIMVLLLNSIFFWLPFLIFCLPLPGLKAKN